MHLIPFQSFKRCYQLHLEILSVFVNYVGNSFYFESVLFKCMCYFCWLYTCFNAINYYLLAFAAFKLISVLVIFCCPIGI